MSNGFKPISVPSDNGQLQNHVDDTDYWMRMKELAVFKEYDIVSSLAFMPKFPHHLATTSSYKSTVFDTSLAQPVWFQGNFKSNVYGVTFRRDGLLMGMGSTDGYVRFFDVQQKNIPSKHPLRLFQAHECDVRTLAFASLNKCATFADDGDIRLWDLTLSGVTKPLWEAKGAHTDRIRAAASSSLNENLLISGSYDHTIKLWDTRAEASAGPLASINHEQPVETLLFHSNNRIVVSAGGKTVKFWDISSGVNKPVEVLNNHSRTVTSLCFATRGQFLLTGGLDRRIHAYRIDRGEFVLVNTLITADSVLSLDIAPNDECMAFSMSSLLCIYRRHPKHHAFLDESTKKVLIGDGVKVSKARKSIVYHQERGADAVRLSITAKHVDQLHLGSFDRLLRSHNYRKIIDQAFTNKELFHKKPSVVVAVLDQLRLAGQLPVSLAGRQGKELPVILQFIAQNLFHSAFFDVLYDVVNVLLVIYAEEQLNRGEMNSLTRLKNQVAHELYCERRLLHILGVLDSLISVSFYHNKNTENSNGTDAVFGDLLIKPKLFSLKTNLPDFEEFK